MADEETLDVEGMVEALNRALRLQYRSVLQQLVAAGSVTGFEHTAMAADLWTNAADDLADARRLIEKIVSLGGEPAVDHTEIAFDADPKAAIDRIIEAESEAINALQDAIEPTGREGRSEAIEHRLEHMIMRKQEAVDTLLRARGRPSG